MPGDFFDTNVLLYMASGQREKADRAEGLVRTGGTISVQVLNEIANVARRKMRMTWPHTRNFLSLIGGLLAVVPNTLATHSRGLEIATRYGLAIYDAMIVSAALLAGCDRLWSEDMQHGMRIDLRLQIANPFRDLRM